MNQGRVLSKAQILDHVWQYDFGGDGGVVETYIGYLRKKLDTGEPQLIHTIRGVGYTLRDDLRPADVAPGPGAPRPGPHRRRARGGGRAVVTRTTEAYLVDQVDRQLASVGRQLTGARSGSTALPRSGRPAATGFGPRAAQLGLRWRGSPPTARLIDEVIADVRRRRVAAAR